MTEQLIRALPIWTGAIRIEPLSGGITNLNWMVADGAGKFAVRVGVDDDRLGIGRRNEVECVKVAAAHGLAPALVHTAPGVMVSAFVEGTPMTPELVREGDRIERVAHMLRRTHAAGADVRAPLYYFSPFQVTLAYVDIAERQGLALPAPGAAGLRAEIEALRAELRPFLPTFCHNDLMPGNLIDAGDRLWVIDWEYGGVGHPLFDLGGFASNCDFAAREDARLLDAYGLPPAQRTEFAIMKTMASLRESLWAVVQGSQSDIDFDYDAYRDDNYRKYRAALTAR